MHPVDDSRKAPVLRHRNKVDPTALPLAGTPSLQAASTPGCLGGVHPNSESPQMIGRRQSVEIAGLVRLVSPRIAMLAHPCSIEKAAL